MFENGPQNLNTSKPSKSSNLKISKPQKPQKPQNDAYQKLEVMSYVLSNL